MTMRKSIGARLDVLESEAIARGTDEQPQFPIIRKILMPGESLTEGEKSLLEERKRKGRGIVMIIRQIVSPGDLG